MITLTREEAQQVLDVIERNIVGVPRYKTTELLRARLSALEPKEFTDKEKIVYNILFSDETLPNGQHWEGFVAQKIVKALAQSEPEPVAWADKRDIEREGHDFYVNRQQPAKDGVPLYTQRKEWQSLTDEEISNLWNAPGDSGNEFARAIEAKLKEKNT
jgi:hypothetical protein